MINLRRLVFEPNIARTLYPASLMILFWAVFDGILSFIIPTLITNQGFTKSSVGLLIASSNIFGAFFDFFLCRFLKNINYRRLLLIVYGLCFVYPLFLWSAKTLPLFIISMAIWGLYGDILNFSTFNFVSATAQKSQHCSHFGVIGVFKSLGYFLAPLIAGLLFSRLVNVVPFIVSLIFLFISSIFYVILISSVSRYTSSSPKISNLSPLSEISLWYRLSLILYPVLFFNVLIHFLDASVWTIGPLFSEKYPGFTDFSGLFVALYMLPTLFMNWFVNPVTRYFGKKKTAFWTFLLSNLFLLPFCLHLSPEPILILIFLSSVVNALAWPAIKGAQADYISEAPAYEKEIEALSDFTFNLGYIIGPLLSGILADLVGIGSTFALIGVINIIIVVVLLLITPKHITISL